MNKLFAVITGDVAGSSRLQISDREKLIGVLSTSFDRIGKICPSETIKAPFEIFRGDSFQGVLALPQEALKAALVIRATLREELGKPGGFAADARIAIGIGTVDLLPEVKTGMGDGEAFQRSGPVLDKMRKDQRLRIVTPSQDLNAAFDVLCSLTDTILARWTRRQAEVFVASLGGLTQEQMAQNLSLSQPVVTRHLTAAGTGSLKEFLAFYNDKIKSM